MGSGKSSAAIEYVNQSKDNVIYVTPYLSEVERIVKACRRRSIKQPIAEGGVKLNDAIKLIQQGKCIAATHSLLARFTLDMADIIREGEYVLIVDEAINATESLNYDKENIADILAMIDDGIITIGKDGVTLRWNPDVPCYMADQRRLREQMEGGTLLCYGKQLLLWEFPFKLLDAFKEVIVLTYQFDALPMRHYMSLHGIEYDYIGVERLGGKYRFTDGRMPDLQGVPYRDKVHIFEGKNNALGGDCVTSTAYSKSWYNKQKKNGTLGEVKKKLSSVCRHYWKGISCADILWTTFEDYRYSKGGIGGAGYQSKYAPCNARGTNEYGERHHVCYTVNVYMNPVIRNYLTSKGVTLNEEDYALAQMLQFIWRSAIRNGEDIYVYVPSMRMRSLLRQWLDGKRPIGGDSKISA